MRIKYDFEDEYKGVDLGEKLDHLLSFPKRYIEHHLQSLKTEMESEEEDNEKACILIGGIKEDDPSITICYYSEELNKKIDEVFTTDHKISLLMDMEDLITYFNKIS